MRGFELCEPESLEDAFPLLDSDDPGIRLIGGGTALMLMMKARLFEPVRLVSLRRMPRLAEVRLSPDSERLEVGAMATFAELEECEAACKAFPVLRQTMRTLANVRVRNVATVGGNLIHADPHLDLPPVWCALDAEASIINAGGERRIPVIDLISGYYETVLEPGDILAGVSVPVRAGWRSRYVKVTTRAVHDWPAIGLAVALRVVDGVVEDVRLVLGAAVERPTRLLGAEAALRGARLDEATLRRAGEVAAAVEIVTDEQGSAPYKRQLLAVHLRRALQAMRDEVTP